MARRELEEWFWQVDASLHRLSEALDPISAIASRRCWQPKIDLTETETRFLLTVELAGVESEDVQVAYLPDRHSLYIRGTRYDRTEHCNERLSAHQLEIFYGEFEREVRLPDRHIDFERIELECRNGFLRIVIPKTDRALHRTRTSIRKD